MGKAEGDFQATGGSVQTTCADRASMGGVHAGSGLQAAGCILYGEDQAGGVHTGGAQAGVQAGGVKESGVPVGVVHAKWVFVHKDVLNTSNFVIIS